MKLWLHEPKESDWNKEGHWPHCQCFENGTESEGLLNSDFYYILEIR